MMAMRALDEAIEIVGAAELARGLRVAVNTPSMWRERGSVPMRHRPGIEQLTGGRIAVERFGADVAWVRVSDPKWPHRRGRPLADFSHATARRGGGTR